MNPPRYWMDETSGLLKPVIEKFLNDQRLTEEEVRIFRVYISQWVDSPVWDQNPHADERGRQELRMLRDSAKVVKNTTEIRLWLARAVEFGMDPL